MSKPGVKNTLLFVHIITHFKEMIRVARVLKKEKHSNPLILFMTPYEGWKKDRLQCELEQIECMTYFEGSTSTKNLASPSFLKKCYFKFRQVLNLSRHLLSKLRLFKKKTIKKYLIPLKLIYLYCLGLKQLFQKTKSKISDLLQRHPYLVRLMSPSLWAFVLIRVYKIIWNAKPSLLPSLSAAAHQFYNHFPKLLKEKQIDLIVFPEHNLFYFTQIAAFLGKKQKIPSIIVPFTIANKIEWSEAFHEVPARNLVSRINKLFSYAFPHWVHVYKNRPLLLPAELILMHEMLKITPPEPWLLNSGAIDFIAAESEAMNEYYIAAGIEKKLLRTTGALYNDELYGRLKNQKEYRDQLYQSFNLKEDKPMLLCALPPNQFFGREELIEFKTYRDAIEFIVQQLSQLASDCHILLHLHPRILVDSVDFIKNYPVHVFQGDIAEAIPLASVYVASCSATIRMANSCGIPVLNYDLYRYRYDDYKHLKGVLTLFDKLEFSKILNKIVKDKAFYESICALQKAQSAEWGLLDGKAGANLIREINSLT